jgi:hypothetical protein
MTNHVVFEIGRTRKVITLSRDIDLEANPFGLVLVFLNELGPKLGSDLLLWIGPTLRVICGVVSDALTLALPSDLDVAVIDGTLNEGGLYAFGHLIPFCGLHEYAASL